MLIVWFQTPSNCPNETRIFLFCPGKDTSFSEFWLVESSVQGVNWVLRWLVFAVKDRLLWRWVGISRVRGVWVDTNTRYKWWEVEMPWPRVLRTCLSSCEIKTRFPVCTYSAVTLFYMLVGTLCPFIPAVGQSSPYTSVFYCGNFDSQLAWLGTLFSVVKIFTNKDYETFTIWGRGKSSILQYYFCVDLLVQAHRPIRFILPFLLFREDLLPVADQSSGICLNPENI